MPHNIIHLDQLPIGKSGRVTSLRAYGLTNLRLLDLGLVPGTKVEALRRSPAGDPTAFSVRGAVIALRNEDAQQIFVRVE